VVSDIGSRRICEIHYRGNIIFNYIMITILSTYLKFVGLKNVYYDAENLPKIICSEIIIYYYNI